MLVLGQSEKINWVTQIHFEDASEAKKIISSYNHNNEEKQKLEVTVKIFGRKTPVELGFTEVEKL